MRSLKPGRDVRALALYLSIVLAAVQAVSYVLGEEGSGDIRFSRRQPATAARMLTRNAVESSVGDGIVGLLTFAHPALGAITAAGMDLGTQFTRTDYNPITGVSTDVPVDNGGLVVLGSLGAALLSLLVGYAIADRVARRATPSVGAFKRLAWVLAAFPLGALPAALLGSSFPSAFGALAVVTVLRTLYVTNAPAPEEPRADGPPPPSA